MGSVGWEEENSFPFTIPRSPFRTPFLLPLRFWPFLLPLLHPLPIASYLLTPLVSDARFCDRPRAITLPENLF